jgi:hypothetical protein
MIVSWNLILGTEENYAKLNEYSRLSGQRFGVREFEAEALPNAVKPTGNIGNAKEMTALCSSRAAQHSCLSIVSIKPRILLQVTDHRAESRSQILIKPAEQFTVNFDKSEKIRRILYYSNLLP